MFFVTAAEAQEKTDDIAFWTTVKVDPPAIAERWFTSVILEYRLKNDLKETDLYSALALIDYKIDSHWRAGLGYEFFLNKMPGKDIVEHRYYPQVTYNCKLQRFSVSLRSRVMNTFTEWKKPNWRHRNRLKISYNIKNTPLRPFVYVEPYNSLSKPFYRTNKIRYAGGCSVILAAKQSLDVFYMQESYHTRPFVRHVIGVDYSYSF